MGERQSGGGESGRRRAHPDDRARGHGSGPAVALDDAELEALLSAAVLRGHRVDTEGEQRAVAAFRAARAAGRTGHAPGAGTTGGRASGVGWRCR
ncbi:hypothetical protein WKI71_27615 [Streptomyces sp. MS1.AVA.1]|uniref:Acyl-CoA carboxylase subunit epsilon n=1 Tax=Streptomyces machairae TaxID=3134109 RepID=A0ABU8UR29_9ACTN